MLFAAVVEEPEKAGRDLARFEIFSYAWTAAEGMIRRMEGTRGIRACAGRRIVFYHGGTPFCSFLQERKNRLVYLLLQRIELRSVEKLRKCTLSIFRSQGRPAAGALRRTDCDMLSLQFDTHFCGIANGTSAPI